MREPPYRLGVMLALVAYTQAFYNSHSHSIIAWMSLGLAGTILFGFASPPNRIGMWVVFVTVFVVMLLQRRQLKLRLLTQITLILALVGALYGYSLHVATIRDSDQANIFALMLTGMETDGTVGELTTVMTCEIIWCRAGEDFMQNETLLEGLSGNPTELISRYAYSIYGNLSAASNVYQQDVILTVQQQYLQQYGLLVIGLLGIGYLLGYARRYWGALLLVSIPIAYFVAVFSINGIETRRLTVVLQVVIIAGAIYGYTLSQLWMYRRRFVAFIAVIALANIGLWMLPLSYLAGLMPAESALIILQIARSIAAVLLVLFHLVAWRRVDAQFHPALPALFLAFVVMLISHADHTERSEYEWRHDFTGRIQQRFEAISSGKDYLLLIDLANADEARSLAINVGDVTVKEAGEPMWRYMDDTLATQHVDTFAYEDLRAWYAYPISAALLAELATDDAITFTIIARERVTLAGNHLIAQRYFIGAGTHPFEDLSFQYLLYTSDEPRVPRTRDVAHVSSARFNEDDLITDDLSPEMGYQGGIYSILLQEQGAFTPQETTP